MVCWEFSRINRILSRQKKRCSSSPPPPHYFFIFCGKKKASVDFVLAVSRQSCRQCVEVTFVYKDRQLRYTWKLLVKNMCCGLCPKKPLAWGAGVSWGCSVMHWPLARSSDGISGAEAGAHRPDPAWTHGWGIVCLTKSLLCNILVLGLIEEVLWKVYGEK